MGYFKRYFTEISDFAEISLCRRVDKIFFVTVWDYRQKGTCWSNILCFQWIPLVNMWDVFSKLKLRNGTTLLQGVGVFGLFFLFRILNCPDSQVKTCRGSCCPCKTLIPPTTTWGCLISYGKIKVNTTPVLTLNWFVFWERLLSVFGKAGFHLAQSCVYPLHIFLSATWNLESLEILFGTGDFIFFSNGAVNSQVWLWSYLGVCHHTKYTHRELVGL